MFVPMLKRLCAFVCVLCAGWLIPVESRVTAAQSKPAEHRFDVASVKLWVGDEHGGVPGRFDLRGLGDGRMAITAMFFRDIVAFAYPSIARNQFSLVGGPANVMSARFDIEARFDPQSLPSAREKWIPDHVLPMVRTLLTDRFRLKTHTETKDLPVFALGLARSDGRLGSGIRKSETICPPVGPPKPVPPGEAPPCEMIGGGGRGIKSSGVPLQSLAEFLTAMANLDREVIDETGLRGLFDITVTMDPKDRSESLVSAVQEQLGLKLTSKTGKRTVLVVDHAEMPTPN